MLKQSVNTANSPPRKANPRNLFACAMIFMSMGAAGYIYFKVVRADAFLNASMHELSLMCVYMLPLPLSLFLANHWPAVKGQELFSRGMALDLAYHVIHHVMQFSLLVVLWPLAWLFYSQYLSFLTIQVSEDVPIWLRLLLLFLFTDFLFWLHHFVRHKIPFFWFFHTVHHSQREMNYFTDSRVHVFERLWATLIVFIPTFMIQIPVPSAIALTMLAKWHSLLYHSNIKTNYGWLRYVLVTPQSHRIHHSTLPQHYDTNFGVSLSIWDHVFRTQYRNYDEYPDTGIADEAFPVEHGRSLLDVFDSFGAQFLYPFDVVFRKISALVGKGSR